MELRQATESDRGFAPWISDGEAEYGLGRQWRDAHNGALLEGAAR
jgi:hypothetical protein